MIYFCVDERCIADELANAVRRVAKKVNLGGGDQAYTRLSTTHGHIMDCKLYSVVYAGVGVW